MKTHVSYSTPGILQFIKALLVVLVMVMLVSCAGGPQQRSDGQPAAQKKYTEADVDSDLQDDFQQALTHLKNAEYQQAIDILLKMVEKEQRFTAPFVNLGMAYAKQGDNKLAEENLRRALDIDLGHAVANNELGLIYRKQGRFEDARKAYENALAVHPEYLPARKNLGILCEIYLRDLNCALEQFEQYQQYVPDDKTVNIWVVDLKRRLGQ